MFVLLIGLAGAADVAAGKALYEANCTACHGAKGDGKGAAAVALKPKPTDFTTATYWAGKTDAGVGSVIRGGKPGTPMTAFTQFSEADAANVVGYLRTLAPAP